jgi:hypothetical protein
MKRATLVVAICLTKAKDMVAPEAKDLVAPGNIFAAGGHAVFRRCTHDSADLRLTGYCAMTALRHCQCVSHTRGAKS